MILITNKLFTIFYYNTPYGIREWGIVKWKYRRQSSWRHGTIYFWKFKFVW